MNVEQSTFKAAVTCEGVWKVYLSAAGPVRALQDISFELPVATLTWIKGASGSGKSTLLALLGALDTPTQGRVTTLGVSLESLGTTQGNRFRRHNVGYMMPDLGLVSHLTALENVTLALMFEGLPVEQVRGIARRLLEEVEIATRASHLPGEMSLGERSRALLARALAGAPRLLLADEPTGNLDTVNALRVMAILAAQKGHGRTIVIASHDDRLATFADMTLELAEGRMVDIRRGK